MKKILIAVDSPNNSQNILSLFQNLDWEPDNIILLHVEQLEGNSMMTAMLGDAEISTLKESVKDTEYKEALDRRAERVLAYYRKKLENFGLINVNTLVRQGNPSDEILQAAEEEDVDMIIVGCSGKSRLQRLVSGCASRDVEKNAKVPVLITKGSGCGEHAYLWQGREAYVS